MRLPLSLHKSAFILRLLIEVSYQLQPWGPTSPIFQRLDLKENQERLPLLVERRKVSSWLAMVVHPPLTYRYSTPSFFVQNEMGKALVSPCFICFGSTSWTRLKTPETATLLSSFDIRHEKIVTSVKTWALDPIRAPTSRQKGVGLQKPRWH